MHKLKPAAPRLLDLHPHVDDLEASLIDGLALAQKRLPSLYFYDEYGSQLFDDICELPEYYPTRTELAIMQENIADICVHVGAQASLIELGSGSSLKTRLLLEHLPRLAAYVPVDISKDHLLNAATDIAQDYPAIEVLPVCADFTEPFALPSPAVMPRRNLLYFPGSTIGNFDPAGALSLLISMRKIAKPGGAALIGVDLRKDRATLEAAYNDAQGVTAAFNLNMLTRLNREMEANFDVDAFAHRAIWNDAQGRIEMHLVSQRQQSATVAGREFHFDRDEYILTEYSHKYTLEQFASLARDAGFQVDTVWTDPRQLFSVQMLACPEV